MLTSTASFAAVVVAASGFLIFWSNPGRTVNRAVGFCSLFIAAWLGCWHLTATFARDASGPFWFRLTYSVGALAPIGFWMVKESIFSAEALSTFRWMGRKVGWWMLPLFFCIVPFTDWFIPSYSTQAQRVYGWGFSAYFWALPIFYALLLTDALRGMRKLSGGRRLELQVWLFGGCVLAATIYGLIGLNNLTGDVIYRRLQPIAVLIFYGATAYTITTHRIFDARQILLVGVEKLFLVTGVAAVVFLCKGVFDEILPPAATLLAVVVISLWFAAVFNRWLNGIFKFYPQALEARQAAFDAAKRETRLERLETAFVQVLKGWGQSERAVILTGGKEGLRGSDLSVLADSPVLAGMRELCWATPERLAREKSSPERDAVAAFLAENQLSALVFNDGPSLVLMAGVGASASRRVVTYPQITQLIELGSIMESALARAHFSAKVQHTEQLATVGLLGASLAHEIRNPLVTIKTFVQLLPKHHQDPAFREKFFRLIGDEVGRIDQLTEQLLDLASPRTYEAKLIELHPLLRSSLDLVATKAAHRNVQFMTEFAASPDRAFTDASAAKQVVLNLCFNAIQAVEEGRGESRWVKVATRNIPSGIEMAVADSGPGIAPEMRSRLFQPFQTTKSTGFGLGLAICSDILANLHASITVDPPAAGHGATFRVIFPCRPLSS